MTLDDWFEDDNLTVFGREIFEEPGLDRYKGSTIVDELNTIAAYDFEFGIQVVDFLRDQPDHTFAAKVLQSMARNLHRQPISTSKNILKLSKERERLTDAGFQAVVYELGKIEDESSYVRFADYAHEAADTIGAHASDESLHKALETLALTAIRDTQGIKKKSNPSKIIVDSLTSDVLRQYTSYDISTKVPYQKLPENIKDSLEEATAEDLGYRLALLSDFPVLRFAGDTFEDLALDFVSLHDEYKNRADSISKEFEEARKERPNDYWYSETRELEVKNKAKRKIRDESVFGYIQKWVGENTSEERFRFYMDVQDNVGMEAMPRLGKRLMRALYQKGKGNKKALRSFANDLVPNISAKIITGNVPPRWIHQVRKKVPDVKISNIARVAEEVYQDLEAPKIRKERIERFKHRHPNLAKKTKKEHLDYLLELDADILNLLGQCRNPTQALENMVEDLDAIKNIFEARVTEGYIIALFENGHSISEVQANIADLDSETRKKLNIVRGGPLMFALAKKAEGLEERLDAAVRVTMETTIGVQVLDFLTDSVEDPIYYADQLKEGQVRALKHLVSNVDGMAKIVVGNFDPSTLGDFELLAINLNDRYHDFLGQSPLATLNAYNNLTDEQRETLMEAIPTAEGKGVLVRDFDPAQFAVSKSFTQGIGAAAWANFRDRFGVSYSVLYQDFLSVYGSLDDENQLALTNSLVKYNEQQRRKNYTNWTPREILEIAPLLKKPESLVTMVDLMRNGAIVEYAIHIAEDEIAVNAFSNVPENQQENWLQVYQKIKPEQQSAYVELPVEDVPKVLVAYDFTKHFGAEGSWTNNFQTALEEGRVNEFTKFNLQAAESFQQVSSEYKRTWKQFAQELGLDKVASMPTEDFYLAAQAYEFAIQNGVATAFYSALTDSIASGTVQPWAKTIIDHFRSSSKGGGNYRALTERVMGVSAK